MCVIDDHVLQARIEKIARDLEMVVLSSKDAALPNDLPGRPRAILIDISLPGALEAIAAWKRDSPDIPVIGAIRVPDAELWAAAESAGADLISSTGTVHRHLGRFLDDYGQRSKQRIRVGPAREFDGRLGLIARIEDGALASPIALYHVGYEIYAVADTCPHAGAELSRGALEGPVVTCPRHGSQFDVTTGERLRGPADDALKTYTVLNDGGILYVESDE